MDGDFWHHMGFMLVTFLAFLLPGLASRDMERSDYVTLLVIPIVTLLAAIVPSMLIFGFDKNSGTYVLGILLVVVVATVNRAFPSRPRSSAD
jgi:hypothetical protein